MSPHSDDLSPWLQEMDSVAVALLRQDGKVLHANPAFTALTHDAGWLVEPSVAQRGRSDDACLHRGKVVLGAADGRKSAHEGRLYCHGEELLLVCEAAQASTGQLQQEIKQLRERIDEVSRQDSLTGLANRKYLDTRTDEEVLRWQRYHRPLALIVLDLDDFGAINRSYGREAADEALLHVGTILRQSTRSLDVAARYGGEEFAVVMVDANAYTAASRAESIRTMLAQTPVNFQGHLMRLTLSVGVAGMDTTRLFTQAAQLTNAADRALYAAKGAGRNAVRLFRPRIDVMKSSADAVASN